ncbi:MAG: thioredoxin domain-containing protein [Planctomycetota bacterium]
MSMQRLQDPAAFQAVLSALQATSGSGLFCFFGSELPDQELSWCPDCVTADPVIRMTLQQVRPELVFYACPVGSREQWRCHDHVYRQHPFCRLERIPTVILMERGLEIGRLVEEDCADEQLLAAFVAGER